MNVSSAFTLFRKFCILPHVCTDFARLSLIVEMFADFVQDLRLFLSWYLNLECELFNIILAERGLSILL